MLTLRVAGWHSTLLVRPVATAGAEGVGGSNVRAVRATIWHGGIGEQRQPCPVPAAL